MTRINVVTLISEQNGTDSIGQVTTTETTSKLIAEVRSVSQSEYMNGKQSGLTPSYVFRVSMFGYAGQKILLYKGARYSVYRTYEADDNYVELYTECELGVTNV